MKTTRFVTLAFAFASAAVVAAPAWNPGASTRRYAFELQFWRATCAAPGVGEGAFRCELPRSDASAARLEFSVPAPTRPQDVRQASAPFESGDWRGRVVLYRAFPPSSSADPRYLQLRVEVFAPLRLLCLETVRDDVPDAALLPTLHCAAFEAGDPRSQRGLNLVSKELVTERR